MPSGQCAQCSKNPKKKCTNLGKPHTLFTSRAEVNVLWVFLTKPIVLIVMEKFEKYCYCNIFPFLEHRGYLCVCISLFQFMSQCSTFVKFVLIEKTRHKKLIFSSFELFVWLDQEESLAKYLRCKQLQLILILMRTKLVKANTVISVLSILCVF